MNLHIRKAIRDDIPLILQFIKQIAEYEKLLHQVEATEETLRSSLFGDNPSAEVLLCFDNEKPVAYAVFFHNFSTFTGIKGLYLEDIFVLPEYRRSGIGKTLFTKIASIALERGCGRMDWAVLDWNSVAIDFYKRIGAAELPEWRLFRLTRGGLEDYLSKN